VIKVIAVAGVAIGIGALIWGMLSLASI